MLSFALGVALQRGSVWPCVHWSSLSESGGGARQHPDPMSLRKSELTLTQDDRGCAHGGAQCCSEEVLCSPHSLGAQSHDGPDSTPGPGPAAPATFSWAPGSLLLWGYPGPRRRLLGRWRHSGIQNLPGPSGKVTLGVHNTQRTAEAWEPKRASR